MIWLGLFSSEVGLYSCTYVCYCVSLLAICSVAMRGVICSYVSEILACTMLQLTVSLCTDVFEQGAWNQLKSVDDPEFRELAQALPDIVLRGKAPSTIKQYSGAFLRWKAWASKKREVCCFPVSPFCFSLYLAYLVQKVGFPAPVEQAVCAAPWVHKLAVQEDPTEHPVVKQMLAGAKRILAKAVVKKTTNNCKHVKITGV